MNDLRGKRWRISLSFAGLLLVSLLFFMPFFWPEFQSLTLKYAPLLHQIKSTHPGMTEKELLYCLTVDAKLPSIILLAAMAGTYVHTIENILCEKTERTLEHLLVLPLSKAELLGGKILSSICAGFFLVVGLYLFHLLYIFLMSGPSVSTHLVGFKWIFIVLVLAPSLSFLANSIAIMLAVRIKRAQTGINLGLVLLAPFILPLYYVDTGTVFLGTELLLLTSFIVSGAALIFFWLAHKLFNKEVLLLRF